MINPFDNEYQSLVNLSNGTVAHIGDETDMKNMHEKRAASMSYMKTSIVSCLRSQISIRP